jgi:hypothetical protein
MLRIASFVGVFSAAPYALRADPGSNASGDLVCDDTTCCPQNNADCCASGSETCDPRHYDKGSTGDCPPS